MHNRTHFETATLLLEELGVGYSMDHEYRRGEEFKIPLITYVNFNFTKIEWFEIASTAGEQYIGGCCGQTSAAQDIISKWFRFDPNAIPVNELEELAYIMKSHDGIEEIDPESPRVTFAGLNRPVEEVVKICAPKWNQMWLLDRMVLVWHIIKDVHKIKPVYVEKTKCRSEVERAIGTAQSCIQYFWFKPLFHSNNDEANSQNRADDTMRMFRLLPALKTITDHIASEMYEGPFEGYALWNIADDHISENGYGLCIFYTREECDELISRLEKDQENYEKQQKINFRDKLAIKRVRVSLENGLEVLD